MCQCCVMYVDSDNMGVWNNIKNWWNKTENESTPDVGGGQPQIEFMEGYGNYHEVYNSRILPIKHGNFHGEKTSGELGSIYKLTPSYQALRLRSYEAELTNDVVNIFAGKFFKWVIGKGLKLQSEPNEIALKTEKMPEVEEDFREFVEARFDVYANSKKCDYKEENNLHTLAIEAFKTAFHGDCLIVMRLENGFPTIQLIDGEHVVSPVLDDDSMKAAKKKGHTIRNGIEFDKKGKQVAYFVKVENKEELLYQYERIPAFGKRSGRRLAWLVGLKKHRIDNDRHIPMVTPILEKLAKLDRYTEATVGSAEERAKIPYSIEHNKESGGTNPMLNMQKAAAGMAQNAAPETVGYEQGEKTAAIMTATTGKQVFNMPIGAKLNALFSQNEIQYEAFWKGVFKSLCGAVDIPPEVALQEYNSNYSASRAAIGAWDFIVKIYRQKFAEKFYAPFYELWLHTEILKGNLTAKGYLKNSTNFMVVEAYAKSRFVGGKMPHIDPLKEVKAISEMVSKGFMTNEQGTEELTGGDWKQNQQKLKKEKEISGEDNNEKDGDVDNEEQNLKVVNGDSKK